MSSQRRIDSSRINGAKSHGPISPEGKRISSLNALDHGMCVSLNVLKSENPEGFVAILQYHVKRLQPIDQVELGIVEELAASRWRMRRAWLGETETFDKQMTGNKGGIGEAFLWMADAPAMTLAHRYENRQHIIYQRSLRSLKMLREMPMPDYGEDEITEVPSEPNPISEHPKNVVPIAPAPPTQPIDPESLAVRTTGLPAGRRSGPTPLANASPHAPFCVAAPAPVSFRPIAEAAPLAANPGGAA